MPLVHEQIYTYRGYYECESCCRIRVYERLGGAFVIVASELTGELERLGDNQGTSITNMAEALATVWRARYPARPITWIEHYPARGCRWERCGQTVWQFGETFSLVRFTWNNRRQHYHSPQWSHLSRERTEMLIGASWPEPEAMAEDTNRRG